MPRGKHSTVIVVHHAPPIWPLSSASFYQTLSGFTAGVNPFPRINFLEFGHVLKSVLRSKPQKNFHQSLIDMIQTEQNKM